MLRTCRVALLHGSAATRYLLANLDNREACERGRRILRTARRSMRTIERLQSTGDLEGLARLVREGTAHERLTAAWELGKRGEQGVRHLVPILQEGQGEETWEAAMGLSRAGSLAVEPLIEALATGKPETRTAAAWALEEIGDERAVEALIQALSDTDTFCRWTAAACLLRLGRDDGRQAAEEVLQKESEEARGYIGILAEGS
ncbi:HEAT repeat domain-containing protein [Methanofollis formosanus]|uniref:HEAT repeat domain-containing protein n=2 Tax=Methanofollis formosanus TaxID=299308 RepID=A0A8G1A216_9EURY|nr:HEAT repeat domain-containing protein [Methanofollis formosanus]